MKVSKKIESFTLSEMMVVLVLSAIVVSIALVVLTLVQKQVYSINKIQEERKELVFLERSLWQDFNKGQMKYDLRKSTLLIDTILDSVYYQFGTDYVLRNSDTIFVKVEELKLYLDGSQVKENYCDAIEIFLSGHMNHKELFVFKDKDATFYMNF